MQDVAEQVDETFLAALHLLHDCRGKVLVTGSGTSATVARRMAHLLAMCGTPAVFLPEAPEDLRPINGAQPGTPEQVS